MSRKCPACKKWLAAGQYVCKCGAGETKTQLSQTDQNELQRLYEAIRRPGEQNYSGFNVHSATSFFGKLLKRAEDDECAKFMAVNEGGRVLALAVTFDQSQLVQKLLPHVVEYTAARCPDLRMHLISLAITRDSPKSLQVLVETNKAWLDIVDVRTGLKPYEYAEMLLKKNFEAFGITIWNYPWSTRFATSSSLPVAISIMDKARGLVTHLGEEAGMALRAQRNATAGEGVMIPAPFPRSLWVMIVARCNVREKLVILPLVCRFFRLLSTPEERWHNLVAYFEETYPEPKREEEPLPGWRFAFPHTTRDFSHIRLNPALAYTVSVGARSRDRLLDVLSQASLYESKPNVIALLRATELESLARGPNTRVNEVSISCKDVSILFKLQTKDFVKSKLIFSKPGHQSVALRVQVAHGMVGSWEGGTEGLKRLNEGLTHVRNLLERPSLSSDDFFLWLGVSLSRGRSNLPNFSGTYCDYLKALFVGSTAGLTVTLGESAEKLLQSAEVRIDQFEGISVLKVLNWSPQSLASFLEANDLDMVAEFVKEKNLRGRQFIEQAERSFLPPSVRDPKQVNELCEKIRAAKKQYGLIQ